MGLLSSLFSRSEPADDQAADTDSADSVARARSRARQRLLGAVVLVGIGIIGFPLVFETQPRPIPVDVPIEIPARDGVAPLKLPGAKDGAEASKSATGKSPAADKADPIITETAAEAGTAVTGSRPAAPAEPSQGDGAARTADRSADKPSDRTTDKAAEKATEKAPEKTAEQSSDKAAEKAGAKPPEKTATKPAEKPADKPADKPAEQADAARARALLEGKVAPKDAAASARYIVQIGAFADPALARATRLKVERLGLVTYTHVAKTPDGERTRVRVGPVTSRDEAEKIAAKIKAAGLPTAILTL